jgi:ATP-dependent Clp protease ATP-binding subunit ClpC
MRSALRLRTSSGDPGYLVTVRLKGGELFERYTEKARRVIFFARYEASQFGSQAIETEHILLGLLREDKQLTQRFFQSAQQALESIRKEIRERAGLQDKVAASVDLPLSSSAKQVLTFAAEESDRLGHPHIGTEHLLLGILREEKSTAAQILYQRGLRLDRVREDVETFQETEQEPSKTVLELEARQGVSDVKTLYLGRRFTRLLDLLVHKGVIDEDERRQITDE